MRRFGYSFSALVSLFIVASLVPVTGATAAASGADRDRNKIFDSLDDRIAGAGAREKLDAIVLFTQGDSRALSREAQGDVGQFSTSYEYTTLPAVAAELTPGQIRSLAARPDVVHIQPNETVEFALDTAKAAVGADRAALDFGVDGNNEASAICPGARQYCKDDVVVAVIDSGIDSAHVDLDGGKVLGGIDCSTGSCMNLSMFDGSGHGSHVASIIAGEGDGDPRMRGIAPGAALVSVKVGSSGTTVAALDAALEWIVANRDVYGIDLVNMSLSGRSPSDGTETTSRLTNRLTAAGITPFAAAGNGTPEPGQVSFPAAAKYAMAIANMSDPADVGIEPPGYNLWYGSKRGPTLDGRIKPDVAAYGVDITAADANSGNGYKTSGGTSAATPFATGVAALMLDANPAFRSSGAACDVGDTSPDCLDGVIDATMSEPIKDSMRATAIDWNGPGPDNESGAGRLDPVAAVDAASPLAASSVIEHPSHDFVDATIAAGTIVDHPVVLTHTRFALAASVIAVDRAAGVTTPDLDISILDPAGNQVAFAATETNLRQESVGIHPSGTGTYVVRVHAVNGGGRYWLDISYPGETAAPPTPTPTPTAPSTPPVAPTGLAAVPVAGSTSQIDVAWNDVAGEDGYRLERSADGISGWLQIASPNAGITAFRDTGLTASTSYYYRILAYNGAGSSAYSSTASARTNGDTTPPTVPTNVKATAGKAKVTLTWTASTDSGGSGLAGYKVFRATSTSGPFAQIAIVSTTSFADTAVTKGKVYYYYVAAYDRSGNTSAASTKVSAKPT